MHLVVLFREVIRHMFRADQFFITKHLTLAVAEGVWNSMEPKRLSVNTTTEKIVDPSNHNPRKSVIKPRFKQSQNCNHKYITRKKDEPTKQRSWQHLR